MLRVLAIVWVISSTAYADAQLALLTGTAWRTTTDMESHVAPGPGVALDVVSARDGFSVGAHVGWISGWNRIIQIGTPSDIRSFDSLLQIHVLFQYRDERFAIGGGLGIDDHHASSHYADPLPDQSSSFTHDDVALGAHVQASYDVASIDAGTFAAYAGAGIFHIFHPADLCPGECTPPHQTYALWVGAAFRFH